MKTRANSPGQAAYLGPAVQAEDADEIRGKHAMPATLLCGYLPGCGTVGSHRFPYHFDLLKILKSWKYPVEFLHPPVSKVRKKILHCVFGITIDGSNERID
jgi:hypothetical protein